MLRAFILCFSIKQLLMAIDCDVGGILLMIKMFSVDYDQLFSFRAGTIL